MPKPDSTYRPELDSDNYERLNPIAQQLGVSMTFLVNQLLRNIKVAKVTTLVEMASTKIRSGEKIIIVDPRKASDYTL